MPIDLLAAPGRVPRPLTLAGVRTMIDSAFPLPHPRTADITLIYAGGDTPHPWTVDDVAALRTRYLMPCWVRSNPRGTLSAESDAPGFIGWLRARHVPAGCAVVLDLETAVDGPFVTRFDQLMHAAGYPVIKYGSLGFIFRNPPTRGGTFVAAPGVSQPVTIGDTVATQFAFDGAYDLSWVLASVPLWDTTGKEPADMPITDADATKIAKAVGQLIVDDASNATVRGVLRRTDTELAQVASRVHGLAKNQARQLDPAAVAAAVVSDLAAGGFTAPEIAAHILAGLPADLAAEVVAAMGAALGGTDSPPHAGGT